MKQSNNIDVHNELCHTLQSAKETYYRQAYDAPELDIRKLFKSQRKRRIKKAGRLVAILLLFVASSVSLHRSFCQTTATANT